MFGLTYITNAYIETFLYVFLRVAGFVMISPVFGRRNLPALFKAGLCFMLSLVVMPLLPEPKVYTDNLAALFVSSLKELTLGMVLGYVTIVIFSIAISAGQIIDMQIGFGLSNFFDLQFGMQIPITGNFLNIILMFVFFSVNGHHELIWALVNSFVAVQPGRVMLQMASVKVLVDFFVWFCVIVIKVAMPIMAVSVIIEVALGIIVKTMPQMNMFVVGIPVKLFFGLLTMLLMVSVFILFFENAFDQMLVWYEKIMQGLVAR